MSNPYTDLQLEFQARIAAHATLGLIPSYIESLGDINQNLENALAGLKKGPTQKNGLSIGYITPAGKAGDETVRSAELTILRVSLWCKPTVNNSASGFQLLPLEALFLIRQQLGDWDRGPGVDAPKFLTWDSIEDRARGIVNYFADFEVFHILPAATE